MVDWAAMGIVAVVSIVSSVVFTVLLAGGIRLVSAGAVRANQGQGALATRSAGWALLVLAAGLVLYGIYLILPISR